uniref:Uncharacterized protein n=1 Tax=Kalanchoe fedtschenkoi TaxID=63787 RepID=A0A7N0UBX9_KALFE
MKLYLVELKLESYIHITTTGMTRWMTHYHSDELNVCLCFPFAHSQMLSGRSFTLCQLKNCIRIILRKKKKKKS